MPKHFLIFFLFFLPSICIAQEPDSTEYYRTYEDKFNIQLLFKTRPTHLQLANDGNRILFRPNSRPQIGIGGSVVNIGFALYVRMPESIGREPSTFGETDYTDFQFNYYRSHFALTFHYLKYSGFYVNNAADFDTPPFVPLYPLSEDVALEGGSLMGLYLLDAERLSFRAPYNNSDRQMVGAGSFLAMTEISHYVLGSDSLVVPEDFLNFFDSSSDFQGGSFTGLSLMPGYTRTFVVDKFYLNATLAAGPDIQYNSFNTSGESDKNWHVAAKVNGQAAIGYDNDKLFGSVTLTASRRRFGTEQLIVGNDTANIVFTLGHRFQEFNWMNRLRKSEIYERVMNPLSNF
jgi:hypothetical protein